MVSFGQRVRAAAAAVVTAAALSACGSGGHSGGSSGTIEYWLWDSAQQPGYQKCADAFAQANPGLRINISQVGWDAYWSKLTAGFIADTAPDVFTDHLSKFAQYVDLKVLRPLDDLGPTSDIKDSDYQEGLAQLWKGQDGKRYGAPKDWERSPSSTTTRRSRPPVWIRLSCAISAGIRRTAGRSRRSSRASRSTRTANAATSPGSTRTTSRRMD
jgi:maltose-binding protein MalE